MANDLDKQTLYESVKTLLELEDVPHIHLHQHKLFTLFSLAFQYLLFCATKWPGAYILRIEDSQLAEKLAKKSKDISTRKFIQTLLLPRKLKYHKSVFYLDFFHFRSWNLTNDLPKDKIKGALIVKNTSKKPMIESEPLDADDAEGELSPEEEAEKQIISEFPPDYYYTSLQEFVPKTLIIAYENDYQNVQQVSFDFIKKDENRTVSGVTISKNMDWDKLD